MNKILTFFISLIILCGIIYIIQNPSYYNKNYWEDIKIQGSHLYPNIVMQLGEPQEIKKTDDETIVEYSDVRFVWYSTELKGIFARAEIISDKVFIGKRKLCMGSDKKEVKNAYKSVFIKEIQDLAEDCLGYIDNEVCIVYNFDEDDKVKGISISHGI